MNKLGRNRNPFFFMIDFEMKNPRVYDINDLPNDLYFKTGLISHLPNQIKKTKSIIFNKYPISFCRYKEAFKIAKSALKNGNSYLLNLTFETPVETNLSLSEIFNRSNTPYKLLNNNQFVSFSPEPFIKINQGKIFTYPMKGTIDANIPNAKKIILNDEKEQAEHFTVVDLLRNDLSMVAKQITVEKLRYVETIKTNTKTLLQVSSKISGKLPNNYNKNIGNIISKLLPAGSVSGAPKKETLKIIRQAEGTARGFYTGIMGVFDGQNLDSAVLIRFIENVNGKFVYKSGGGITFLSDAQAEYQELIDKIYVPFN